MGLPSSRSNRLIRRNIPSTLWPFVYKRNIPRSRLVGVAGVVKGRKNHNVGLRAVAQHNLGLCRCSDVVHDRPQDCSYTVRLTCMLIISVSGSMKRSLCASALLSKSGPTTYMLWLELDCRKDNGRCMGIWAVIKLYKMADHRRFSIQLNNNHQSPSFSQTSPDSDSIRPNDRNETKSYLHIHPIPTTSKNGLQTLRQQKP